MPYLPSIILMEHMTVSKIWNNFCKTLFSWNIKLPVHNHKVGMSFTYSYYFLLDIWTLCIISVVHKLPWPDKGYKKNSRKAQSVFTMVRINQTNNLHVYTWIRRSRIRQRTCVTDAATVDYATLIRIYWNLFLVQFGYLFILVS